ncbi:MAG: hypothetical protein ACI8UR_001337 [Natronomonas sp.]|jgi:hypothetical protein|uniref:hypothetical protein n=1 Tax=Natronomonas sp. TaxID=2184060 RepID=UPI0039892E23
MTRVPITDDVVEQLSELLEADALDHEHNYMGAQFAARDYGFEELAQFVYEADAATYYEAIQQAKADRQASSTS